MNRQLSLQNIIKTQQTKICQLREQLNLVNQLAQVRLTDCQKQFIKQMQQKQNVILYLTEQIRKLKNQQNLKVQQQKRKIQIVRQELQFDCQKYQAQYKQLQIKYKQLQKKNQKIELKLQKTTQQYQIKQNGFTKQNKKLMDEILQSKKFSNHIQIQIQKLTKFYKSSLFQLPKRKQTLLWVDKLINFMQISSKTSSTKYQQMFQHLKTKLTILQTQLINLLNQICNKDQSIYKDNLRIYQDISNLISQKDNYEKEIEIKTQELLRVARTEKQQAQKGQYQQLKINYSQLKNRCTLQVEQFNKRLKQAQDEKKVLIMSLQQLKIHCQSRESISNKQISLLKSSVSSLLSTSQTRQIQFSQQISSLSNQILSLSTRYYQNIQYPLIKVNQNVQREIIKIKDSMDRIRKDNGFYQGLKGLQNKLEDFVKAVQNQQQNTSIDTQIQQANQLLKGTAAIVGDIYAKNFNSTQHKLNTTQIIDFKPLFQQTNYLNKSVLFSNYQQQQQQKSLLKSLKQQVSYIQQKQRESKLIYQVKLLKKQNQKLQQHFLLLQKKVKTVASLKDDKNLSGLLKAQRKIIDIQSQLQELKQTNKNYQQIFIQQTQKIHQKCLLFDQIIKVNRVEEQTVMDSIWKVQQKYQNVCNLINKKHQKLDQLQKSINVINNMLIKPVQSFQILLKQVADMSNKSQSFNQPHFQVEKSLRTLPQFTQSARQYQQLLNKKSQLHNNSSRSISQLIRCIRESFPLRQSKSKLIQVMAQKQCQPPIKKPSFLSFQKRIKQVSVQQARYKSQLTVKIQKILQHLSIEKKQSTKQPLFKRIQQTIQNSMKSFLYEIQVEKQRDNVGNVVVTALKDTQAKLKQSVKQNEGLKREIQLILMVRKHQQQQLIHHQ